MFTYFNLGSFEWSLLKSRFLSDLFQVTSLKLNTLPDCFLASSKVITIFSRQDISNIIDISLKPELLGFKQKYFIAKTCIGETNYESVKTVVSKYILLTKMHIFFSSLPGTSYFFIFFKYIAHTLLSRTIVSFTNY